MKYILNNDIQGLEAGLKLSNTHMRIGSKIHLDTFYEAEILFHNNYYTNRFSCLIANDILKKLKENELFNTNFSICILGYETYSEMLVYDIVKQLKTGMNNCPNCDVKYVIFENDKTSDSSSKSANFRFKERLNVDDYIFIVVPISSTLSTFDKLLAELTKEYKFFVRSNVKAFYTAIQVGNEENGSEWYEINTVTHYITPKMSKMHEFREDDKIKYCILVKSNWRDPDDCELCFPRENYLLEKPLIETNKASVIPSQLIGLKQNLLQVGKKELSEEKKTINSSRIIQLLNIDNDEEAKYLFYYGHISRDSKHFKYYIRTANYFDYNRREIKKWLEKEVKSNINININQSDAIVYNIIVSPLHFSNTAFVDEVNNIVFSDASLVLQFDVNREFRDNIKTKYSDITALYKNLVNLKINAEINFHFVDDMLVTGKTFYRAKSLVRSIFKENGDKKDKVKVKINLFSSVILLVNRVSKDTQRNYVDNPERYFSYLNLSISYIRNHGDACVLCKDYMSAVKLKKSASLLSTKFFWHKQCEKRKVKELNIVKREWKESVDSVEKRRFFNRLYCSHKLNESLIALHYEKNNVVSTFNAIVDLIIEKETEEIAKKIFKGEIDIYVFERAISYIKVATSPFLNFRKSVKEAGLLLIIVLAEFIVREKDIETVLNNISEYDDTFNVVKADTKRRIIALKKILSKNSDDYNKYTVLLKVLISQSIKCHSNYFIRRDVMKSIISKIHHSIGDKQSIAEFEKYYLGYITYLISLDSGDSKKIFIEEIVTEELNNNNLNQNISSFYKRIYLENTSLIYDRMKDFKKNIGSNSEEGISEKIKHLLNRYYYISYKELIGMNMKFINQDSKEDIEKLTYANYSLYKTLKQYGDHEELGTNDDVINKYQTIAERIKVASNSQNIYLLTTNIEKRVNEDMIDHKDGVCEINVQYKDTEVFRLLAKSNSKEGNKNDYKKNEILNGLIKGYINNNKVDSYDDGYTFIKKENKVKYTIIRIVNQNKKCEKDKLFDIYIVFEYKKPLSEFVAIFYLRNILAFRNKINKIIEADFNNSSLPNLISQINLNRQLSKTRALHHGRKDSLNNAYNDLKMHLLDSYENADYYRVFYKHLERLVFNLLLAEANRSYIIDDDNKPQINHFRDENHPGSDLGFDFYNDILGKIIHCKDIVGDDKIEIHDKEGRKINSKKSLLGDQFDGFLLRKGCIERTERNNGSAEKKHYEKYWLEDKYVLTMLVELLESASTHGKRVNDTVKITIYRDKGYLCVENRVNDDFSFSKIISGLNRNGDGISLATFANIAIDITRSKEALKVCYSKKEKILTFKILLFE